MLEIGGKLGFFFFCSDRESTARERERVMVTLCVLCVFLHLTVFCKFNYWSAKAVNPHEKKLTNKRKPRGGEGSSIRLAFRHDAIPLADVFTWG